MASFSADQIVNLILGGISLARLKSGLFPLYAQSLATAFQRHFKSFSGAKTPRFTQTQTLQKTKSNNNVESTNPLSFQMIIRDVSRGAAPPPLSSTPFGIHRADMFLYWFCCVFSLYPFLCAFEWGVDGKLARAL